MTVPCIGMTSNRPTFYLVPGHHSTERCCHGWPVSFHSDSSLAASNRNSMFFGGLSDIISATSGDVGQIELLYRRIESEITVRNIVGPDTSSS